MKLRIWILLIILGITSWPFATAQDFRSTNKAEISNLQKMVGTWVGKGWVYTAQGKREDFHIDEEITYDLDSTVLRIRGVGMSAGSGSKELIHDALGVMYYDPFEKTLKMDSWIAKGMHTTSKVEVLGKGKFKWSFNAGRSMSIQYHITIENDKWLEVGEMSRNSEPFMKFFEMNLTKQ